MGEVTGRRAVSLVVGAVLAAAVAASATLAAPAAAATGDAKATCRQATVEDAYDTDGVLDITYASLDLHCDEGDWAVYLETFDLWDFTEMRHLSVSVDTDEDPTNGCDGFDYLVTHGPTVGSGRVLRTPSCAASTWTTSSTDVGLDASAYDNAWIVWPASAVDYPAGLVRVSIELASVYGSVDTAPDEDDLVLQGVERPGSFSNGRCLIPYGATATHNAVARLYRAYFLRDADQSGLNYWVPRYRSGELCLSDISDYFAQSQEFRSRYGSLTNPQFVRLVYVNVLGREPDPSGYSYWAHQITYAGVSRGTMMTGFSESAEFRSLTGLP